VATAPGHRRRGLPAAVAAVAAVAAMAPVAAVRAMAPVGSMAAVRAMAPVGSMAAVAAVAAVATMAPVGSMAAVGTVLGGDHSALFAARELCRRVHGRRRLLRHRRLVLGEHSAGRTREAGQLARAVLSRHLCSSFFTMPPMLE